MNSIELLRHIRADILERHVPTCIDILQTGSSYMTYTNPKNIMVQKNIKITMNFNKKSGEIFNIYETH